tara:strand:- start:178 stop:381 length:204 start_codon:yes stop_codon:yes gene_type:complete
MKLHIKVIIGSVAKNVSPEYPKNVLLNQIRNNKGVMRGLMKFPNILKKKWIIPDRPNCLAIGTIDLQ